MTDTPWEWRKGPGLTLEIRSDNREEVAAAVKTRTFLKVHRYVEFDHPAFVKGSIVEEATAIFRLMSVLVEKR